jgi:hypothetical protein
MLNLTEKRHQMVRNCSSQFMLFINYLGNQIMEEEIGAHAAYMGQMKNESKNFARKPLGKKPFAKPKHRQE